MMYQYEAPSATREWHTAKEVDWDAAKKAIRSQYDQVQALFEIIKTQDDEIKELRQKLLEYRAWSAGHISQLGTDVDELRDRMNQFGAGLGIAEKKLKDRDNQVAKLQARMDGRV